MFEPKRILYAGTRALSAHCLSYLIDRVGSGRFAGILCIPHGERGWWAKEGAPELWEIAERHAIPSLVPADLEGLGYDFIVSVMWDKLFSSGELARAALGGFNFHPAPLPSYRGSFARTHAILNGERSFGVTIHALSEGADQGDIISSSSFPVLEGDTALTLDLRAQAYGYPLFCETWLRLTDGSATRRKQSDIVAETGPAPSILPSGRSQGPHAGALAPAVE